MLKEEANIHKALGTWDKVPDKHICEDDTFAEERLDDTSNSNRPSTWIVFDTYCSKCERKLT